MFMALQSLNYVFIMGAKCNVITNLFAGYHTTNMVHEFCAPLYNHT
jgi:hypothetical protein